MFKECKTKEFHNKLQQLQWNEQGKRGRPPKRWRDETEEDLNITGIQNSEAITSDSRRYRKIVLEAKAHNGLNGLRKKYEECVLNPLTFTFLFCAQIYCYTQNLFTSFIENFLSGLACLQWLETIYFAYNVWKSCYEIRMPTTNNHKHYYVTVSWYISTVRSKENPIHPLPTPLKV